MADGAKQTSKMKDTAFAFTCGFAAGFVCLYLFYNRKQDLNHKIKTSIRKRSRVVSRGPVNEIQDQIFGLEACFFTGMDNILNLSADEIDRLKRYLQLSLADGTDSFTYVGRLKDILVRMKSTELITSRSYGRIITILQNAGIDPSPITVHIRRLTDAVADLRDGFEPHDFQAGDYEFDGVIIHCDDDRADVVRFMENAEDMVDIQNLSLCTMDDFNISMPKLEGLVTVFSRARYVYVYASVNLQQDDFTRFMTDMALIDSLTDQEKRYRFIPIWATESLVRIPQLQQFNGLKYYRYFKNHCERKSFCESFQRHIQKGRAEII